MIYIFTAMYCEAHIFIDCLGLKKVQQNTHFQQFYNETAKILLTISGVGEIAAAAAVSSVCTKYQPKQSDFLLNIGTCAGPAEMNGIFLANKLTEQATGKTFYPDVLYRHNFREAGLVTGMHLWEAGMDGAAVSSDCLYDMEAAAVYQAGAYFFGPHQMLFLKIVSDHGDTGRVSRQQVERLFALHQNTILEFLEWLSEIAGGMDSQECHRSMQEADYVQKVCLDMHCTKAMGDLLRQLIHYLVLTGTDYKAVISKMYEEQILPCKDKREGKKCLAELKKRLL